MNSRPTIQQYRRLAEGLLRKALEASIESKQDLIHHAVSYLTFARAQEQSDDLPDSSEHTEDRYLQVRQLIKQAIEMPTPDGIAHFLDFSTAFRRLGIWNARMAYIQRPGARVIASEYEWKTVSRSVVPDAIPIMILWPFSPIRFLYELEDTEPRIDREAIKDPFAAKGNFDLRALPTLMASLQKQNRFKVIIEGRRQGFSLAGSAATHSARPTESNGGPLEHGFSFGEFAGQYAASSNEQGVEGVPAYRVTFNDRLNPTARFITIAHELGHIFLGHLGECASGKGNDDESGWPDRTWLGKNEKEIEAEAVAYLVASRAGVVPASAQYIKGYATRSDVTKVNLDLVVRSAARIERLSKIRYGSMAFEAPS